MFDAPIYVPFVPIGGRPMGSDRLGLGQVSVLPESARALNAPDESSAKTPFTERQAAPASTLTQQQPVTDTQASSREPTQAGPSVAELTGRARVAAALSGSENGSAASSNAATSGSADATARMPVSSSQTSHASASRVEIQVRLALSGEESKTEYNVVV